MKTLGFTDNEIRKMVQEDYDHFSSFNIISSSKKEYVQETILKECKDGTIETEEKIYNTSTEAYLNMREASRSNISTSYALSSTTSDYTEETSARTFTVNTTFYEELVGYPTYFVKVTIDWIDDPISRFNDLISIAHSSNLSIRDKILSGNSYPWFRASMYYVERTRLGLLDPDSEILEEKEVLNSYHGGNYSNYEYKVNEGIYVSLNLPFLEFTENEEGDICSIQKSDIELSLYAYFQPLNLIMGVDNLVTATFVGGYAHNTLMSIAWDTFDVSLSLGAGIAVSLDINTENPFTDITTGLVQLTNVINFTIPVC